MLITYFYLDNSALSSVHAKLDCADRFSEGDDVVLYKSNI